jgi:hypothetical protein
VESKLFPLGTSATYWPIVPAPGDCEDGEFGGMNGRGKRSTWRKPAPAPICPPQIPLDQTRDWTRAAAVGSQRLIASAMARPWQIDARGTCCPIWRWRPLIIRELIIIDKNDSLNSKLWKQGPVWPQWNNLVYLLEFVRNVWQVYITATPKWS